MLGAFRARPRIPWGLACLSIAVVLFAFGVPFVQAWLYILGLPHEPATSMGPCGQAFCQVTVYAWVPPTPQGLLLAYAIAIPLVLLVAWAIHRGLRTQAKVGGGPGGLDRIARVSLAASMVWMSPFIVAGFVEAWLPTAVADSIRYLFLGSLLVVPGVVASVGAAYLLAEARRRARERRPAAPG